MADRARLLRVHVELTTALRASETWERSYTQDKDTFKRLVREEAELHASLVSYFAGLSERAPEFVDWQDPQVAPLMGAALRNKDDPLWKREQQSLYASVVQFILNLMVIGGQAGESIYNRPIGLSTLDEFIINAANNYTAALVSGVTETTRTYISSAITQSIKRGENAAATIERIQELIASPVRAEMISQTESVNAYQQGLAHFADQTGAETKTWDALAGACDYCGGVGGPAGKTIQTSKSFNLPNGTTKSFPPAHPRCRCGIIYNYAN